MKTEVATRLVSVLEALALHPKMVLLGRPGSGKSTLIAFLALSLAEARLGEAKLEERLSNEWLHGPVLPIRVILRKFAASLPPGLARGCARHVWDFLRQDLVNSELAATTADALRDAAKDKGALFLFDGLDEARDPQNRARVLEAVEDFVAHAGLSCRFLLTSRPYAWEETAPVLARQPDPLHLHEMFVHYTLADFEPGQIESFIQRWYPAVQERGWVTPADAAAKTQELLAAVQREDLQPLARNPLLLTLMATLHSSRAKLPEDRADLYDEVVKLLLERWNETVGADRGLLLELNIPSLKLEDIRLEIQRLAYEAHKLHVGREGTADVAEGDLEAALRPLLQDDRNKAAVVIEYIEKRAGLLLGQGPRGIQRQFTFPHRTFQEFLAGCHLERSPDFYDLVQQLACEHAAHWREVLTFAARRATASRGVPAADRLVHCQSVAAWQHSAPPSALDWRCALIAGEQLLEIGLAAVNSRPEHNVVRERVAGWLAALLSVPVEAGGLPAKERARAGVVLGRLGDPRKGVAPASLEELADMEFCYVPPGTFWMGEGEEARHADCPKPGFWISRFPVTVAQYHLFVEGGGYGRKEFWPEAAQARSWNAGQLKGRFQHRFAEGSAEIGAPFDRPNHPVVGVSWYEALAFCRWLTERWRDRLPKGGEIKLPSEAEWEVAARGGLRVPAPACVKRFSQGLHAQGNLAMADNPHPKAVYPWGDQFSPERANTDETGIGATSAVGAFVGGHSPVGAEELSGNVWEWTRSLLSRGEDLATGLDAYPLMRGGAWSGSDDGALCSVRDWLGPGLRRLDLGFRVVAPPFDSEG
jgi:formylglycine-generating enzyme required for sulfatase activity/energy-coupling factor transporter ATP-binding protein EcfA2